MKKMLALCVSLTLAFSLTACGSQSSTSQSNQTEGSESSSVSNVSSTEQSTGTSSNQPETEPDNRGIPGANYFGLCYVLSNEFGIGLGDLEPASTPELCAYSVYSSYEDQQQSATFDYSLSLDSDEEIISATFGVTNYYSDTAMFLNQAKLYIYAVGLLPYDTAQAETTAEALYDAIDTLEDGVPFVITEGDAKFELYATKDNSGDYSSLFVQISRVK